MVQKAGALHACDRLQHYSQLSSDTTTSIHEHDSADRHTRPGVHLRACISHSHIVQVLSSAPLSLFLLMLLQFNACTTQAPLMVVLQHLNFKSLAVKVMGMVQCKAVKVMDMVQS